MHEEFGRHDRLGTMKNRIKESVERLLDLLFDLGLQSASYDMIDVEHINVFMIRMEEHDAP
jgi:hypothetical protein